MDTLLFEFPDIIFERIETPEGYESAYKLMIKQPLDHEDPSRGYFYQKLYLSHKGFDRPTAIITNGYSKNSNNITEVAKILDANQLNVEHRYFGESLPDSMDYSYLNFRQVTADLHKINQLFKKIYKEKWVSSGISKGGTTTLFYRYFYPEDVHVSIPYVAPVNYSAEDERIYTFLDTIGSEECRKAIYDYQLRLLRGSDKVKDKLRWYTKGKGLNFTYLSFDEAFEYAVLEYPFSFWQYGHDCTAIPSPGENIDTHVQHLIDIVGMDFYSDNSMEAFGSHYYQSATEMGYYGYETSDFEGLIKYLPLQPNPSAAFVPQKLPVTFKPELTNEVAEWLQEKAERIVYINGALDTWSATSVPPNDKLDALWFYLEGKHHANARIRNMNQLEQLVLSQKLSEWMDIPVVIDLEKDKKD